MSHAVCHSFNSVYRNQIKSDTWDRRRRKYPYIPIFTGPTQLVFLNGSIILLLLYFCVFFQQAANDTTPGEAQAMNDVPPDESQAANDTTPGEVQSENDAQQGEAQTANDTQQDEDQGTNDAPLASQKDEGAAISSNQPLEVLEDSILSNNIVQIVDNESTYIQPTISDAYCRQGIDEWLQLDDYLQLYGL